MYMRIKPTIRVPLLEGFLTSVFLGEPDTGNSDRDVTEVQRVLTIPNERWDAYILPCLEQNRISMYTKKTSPVLRLLSLSYKVCTCE